VAEGDDIACVDVGNSEVDGASDDTVEGEGDDTVECGDDMVDGAGDNAADIDDDEIVDGAGDTVDRVGNEEDVGAGSDGEGTSVGSGAATVADVVTIAGPANDAVDVKAPVLVAL